MKYAEYRNILPLVRCLPNHLKGPHPYDITWDGLINQAFPRWLEITQQQNPCLYLFLGTHRNTYWSVYKMPAQFKKMEFLPFTLDRSEAKAFDRWVKDNGDKLWGMVEDLLADNYKISISPDFDNACVIATLICKSDDHPNGNKCFSSRAELWADAVALMVYKHFVIAKGDIWPEGHSSRSWG